MIKAATLKDVKRARRYILRITNCFHGQLFLFKENLVAIYPPRKDPWFWASSCPNEVATKIKQAERKLHEAEKQRKIKTGALRGAKHRYSHSAAKLWVQQVSQATEAATTNAVLLSLFQGNPQEAHTRGVLALLVADADSAKLCPAYRWKGPG